MTEQAAEEQANAAAVRVAALLALYESGQIAAPDLSAAVAAAVYSSKVMVSVLADVLVSTITNLPPVGIRPGEEHLDRIAAAVESIVSEPQPPAERLERLAVAETLLSHRASLQAAIRDQGFLYWRRVVADDPCPDCAPLANEVQPIDRRFFDHPGCRCSLRPSGPPAASPEPVVAPVAPPTTRTAPTPTPVRTLRIS